MADLLDVLFRFPTGILTVLLLPLLIYWTLVLLGGLDIDLLDLDGDLPEGESAGAGGGLLPSLGLTGVPVTVAVSLVVLWAWLLSALGGELLGNLVGTEGWVHGTLAVLLLILAIAGGVGVSALMIRPMRRLFDTPEARSRDSLIGKVCTVTTQRVDEGFGQASFEDGGAGLILQVRARADNGLGRGDKALIIGRDEARQAFRVSPYDDRAEAAVLKP